MEADSLHQRFHIDLPLVLGVVVLSGLGLLVLYSAGGQDQNLLVRHRRRVPPTATVAPVFHTVLRVLRVNYTTRSRRQPKR